MTPESPLRRHQPEADESQLQALFDAMPQLGWAAHPDGWIYYYNQRWYAYTGTTPRDMAGWGWQSVHNPDLLPLVLKRWRHSIATEQPFEMAFQLRRHDGVFRWFLTRIHPMRDADGRLIRWVGINSDIDDQKQAEEAAAAASRAKDEFIAMLSHELRNPLAPIVTALELMDLKDSDEFQRERSIIRRQTDHLRRLVDDVLDVSRFLRGKLEIRRERVSLADVVREAAEMVAPLVKQHQHTLELAIDPNVTVEGDAARLKQVAVNLLTNAAKYTPAGGQITAMVDADPTQARLRIRDTGVGIPEALRPHLFEPFVQKRQALARSEGGLGLGLAIVRSIAVAHGGDVACDTELGRGSEFVVRLPVAPGVGRRPTKKHVPRAAGSSRRVLIVDDNVDAADSIAAALEDRGHVVHVEYTAPAALAAAEVFGPEVAVLDIGLPDMDGYELAQRFRRHPRLHGQRIIAVTGYGQAADRERTAAAGFDVHLVKPVDLDALLTAIDQDRGTEQQ